MSFYTVDLSVLSLTYFLCNLISAVYAPNVKGKEFGGTDPGDNYASLLDGTRKPFTSLFMTELYKNLIFVSTCSLAKPRYSFFYFPFSQDDKFIRDQSKDSVSLNDHIDFPNCDLHHSI